MTNLLGAVIALYLIIDLFTQICHKWLTVLGC